MTELCELDAFLLGWLDAFNMREGEEAPMEMPTAVRRHLIRRGWLLPKGPWRDDHSRTCQSSPAGSKLIVELSERHDFGRKPEKERDGPDAHE